MHCIKLVANTHVGQMCLKSKDTINDSLRRTIMARADYKNFKNETDELTEVLS